MLFYHIKTESQPQSSPPLDFFHSALMRNAAALHSTWHGQFYLLPLRLDGTSLSLAACCARGLLKLYSLHDLVLSILESCGIPAGEITAKELLPAEFDFLLRTGTDPLWYGYHDSVNKTSDFALQETIDHYRALQLKQKHRLHTSVLDVVRKLQPAGRAEAAEECRLFLLAGYSNRELTTKIEWIASRLYSRGVTASAKLVRCVHRIGFPVSALEDGYRLAGGGTLAIDDLSAMMDCYRLGRFDIALYVKQWDGALASRIREMIVAHPDVVTIVSQPEDDARFMQKAQEEILRPMPYCMMVNQGCCFAGSSEEPYR